MRAAFALVVAAFGGTLACTVLFPLRDFDGELGGSEASTEAAAGADANSDEAAAGCAPEPACDANLTIDPDHCGACDHRCLTGLRRCQNALCDAELVYAPLATRARGVALDDLFVYAANAYNDDREGGVGRVEKNTVRIDTLAVHTPDARRIVSRGGALFWIALDGIASSPVAVSTDGGPYDAPLLVPTALPPTDMAVDDQAVFWTMGDQVWRASVATPSDARMIASTPVAAGIAVDADWVYWTGDAQEGDVWRARKDGSELTSVAHAQSYPRDLFVDDEAVTFTTSSTIARVEKGAAVPVVLASNRPQPQHVVGAGPWIYWTEGSAQDVVRVSKCGGIPTRIAAGARAMDLALDATHAYWANGLAIYRVSR